VHAKAPRNPSIQSLFWRGVILGSVLLLLLGCSVRQITAEARTFLNLSLEYLDEDELPQIDIDGLSVGGLSGLTYDRQSGLYWAIADAKKNPRAVALKIDLDESGENPQFEQVSVESLSSLIEPESEAGQPITLDPEGIALGSEQKFYLASEGLGQNNPPLLGQIDVQTGEWISRIPIPTRYLPTFSEADGSEQIQGIYPNLAFESLAVSTDGDRLFTATEAPLLQDAHPESEESRAWVRFLHYWVGVGDPYVVAEHVYPLEPPPVGTLLNGLSEVLFVDPGGHFLAMERAINPLKKSYKVNLYQIAIASATDTIGINQLPENLGGINPIQKEPLLDLSELGIELRNLEGMTFGPNFADGSRSLILVSDNGFQPEQPTQLLLFKLTQLKQKVS
jgi:hypothetical protein